MVDDVGSRDLDDAIWASETADGGWTAVVHIAATAAVVEPGSPQDLRARKRVESKYLRDRTIPMLGQDVEQMATLSEVHDRPALTVTMTFDAAARLTDVAVSRSLLPAGSCVRLSYAEVPGILHDADHALHGQLAASHGLATALLARRTAAGALVLYDLIRGYTVTEDGAIVQIPTQRRTVGYVIVAELMVAAGAAVADWCLDQDLTVLYRNHRTRLLGGDGTDLAADVAASLHDPELFEQLRDRVNRTFGRAEYDTVPRGHHGLRVAAYAHLTSPLRRYPDLITQRIVWDHLASQEPAYTRSTLDAIASEINTAIEARKRDKEAHFKQRSRLEGAQLILNGDYGSLDQKQWRKMFDLMTKVAPSAGVEAELARRLTSNQLTPNDLSRLAAAAPSWAEIRTRLFRSARTVHAEFGTSIVNGRAQLLGEDPPETEVMVAPHRPSHEPLFAVRARAGNAVGAWQIGETKKSAQTQAMWELLEVLCGHATPTDAPPQWPTGGTPPSTASRGSVTATGTCPATALPTAALTQLRHLSTTKRANAASNPISWLTSFAASNDLGNIDYCYQSAGPAHALEFTCIATVAGLSHSAAATTKTQARVAAAAGLVAVLFKAAYDAHDLHAEGVDLGGGGLAGE